jgi:hypothetical protein
MPELSRGNLLADTLDSLLGANAADGLAFPSPADTTATSSTNEFQALHCSHFPIQRGKLVPQLWQTNLMVVLGILSACRWTVPGQMLGQQPLGSERPSIDPCQSCAFSSSILLEYFAELVDFDIDKLKFLSHFSAHGP